MQEANAKGYRRRRRYDEAFKRRAVELSLQGGRTVGEVAKDLGITRHWLTSWRSRHTRQEAQRRPVAEIEAENERLRRENARLREREVILKKSLGILSETPESGMPGSRN
jgi:transposase